MRRRWVPVLSGVVIAVLAAVPAAAVPGAPQSVIVVERAETSVLLGWQPGSGPVRGFKVRCSPAAGVHPDPVTFPDGKLAAFTWTTDDGYDDTLLYEPVFSSRGLHFTAFVNPPYIGRPGRLTWAELESLHAGGHEIANHTYNHTSLIDDRAIALRFVGAEPCSLAISGGRLRTWVNGVPDLDVALTAPAVNYLATLAAFLDAHPGYQAVRLAPPDTLYATYSRFLDPVAGRQIGAGAPAETLTTASGVHDDLEMRAEILDAQDALETRLRLVDPTYRCRTLAYPNHAHTQWAMSTLNELGYLGARSGGTGPHPFYSQGAFKIGFTTTYEVPHSYPRTSNSWSEAEVRARFASRVATWKANREWAVLMAHHEGEVDVPHLEWTIDTIAADPAVWIARFDEVLAFLSAYAVDVGYPLNPATGRCSARIHGLDPGQPTWIVVTAYDDALAESDWSPEVFVPAYSVGTGAAAWTTPVARVRAYPDPFSAETSIEFKSCVVGSTRVRIFDVAGRRVDQHDLGTLPDGTHRFSWDGRGDDGNPLGSGVYWVRIENEDTHDESVARVHLVR